MSSEKKLASLYLIDSIIKNVGGVYIELFESNIANLFCDAFNLCDDKDKEKFIKVLSTWKIIFALSSLDEIKSRLFKKRATVQKSKSVEFKRSKISLENLKISDFLLTYECISRYSIFYFSPKFEGATFLYENFPLQCKSCGFRFQENFDGKKKMQLHLDSHFRKNRRLKERSKRVISRDWFLSVSDWAKQSKTNVSEKESKNN